ncbi:MAG: hypothetical protein IT448_01440 [Phycisphaerales bacterium]|nr:hypothetical protein [Phycisphaerales bacterium]
MKILALLVLSALALTFSSGCAYRIPHQNDPFATPAYSGQERLQRTDRNWAYEGQQAQDDWDHFWLIDPPSRMTTWNVR